jgi:DNA-binding response OmpR family regulator
MSNQIMIVDGELGVRQLLGIMLTRAGFSVISAPDGETALRMLETEQPDAFILDVMTPGMTGIDLCDHIRQRPALTDIPVLFLSARKDIPSVGEALKVRGNRYMAKPILSGRLIAELRNLLS